MDDVTIPGEPVARSALTRRLSVVASGLTAASILVNLVLQVASFLEKRPMQPGQRDRLDTAGLALTVLRRLPGLIKQVRLLVSQLKAA
jgi:hypothetical protein